MKTLQLQLPQEVFRDQIREALSTTEVTVKFTKADGTERVLRGTTNFDVIPEESQPVSDNPPKPSLDSQRVFDLDINKWRSFRWDSVKTATYSKVTGQDEAGADITTDVVVTIKVPKGKK